ncbi:hypothetical protein ACIPRI_04370 [Variovorax sp. LARHSF232]
MLVELMIGLAIAAIAIAAAIASLLMVRDAAGAISEMSRLQQQAAHALRVLGLQARPAGSLALQADEGAFRFAATSPTFDEMEGAAVVHGEEGRDNDSLRLAQLAPPLLPSQRRDCLGQEIAAGQRMEASFQVDGKGSLKCKSSSGQNQPLVAGVTAFKLHYRVRQGFLVRSLRAAEVEQARLWPAVIALEVCLDLHGDERAAAYEGRYTACTGQSAAGGGRLHLVTRQLFRLRTQEGR